MSERDEKRGGSGCAIGLVLVLLFLPVLYLLSLGPAAFLITRNPLVKVDAKEPDRHLTLGGKGLPEVVLGLHENPATAQMLR